MRRTTEEDGHGKYLGGRDHRLRAQGTTDWIQQQGDQVLISCVGSSQAETETETDRGQE